MLLLGISVIENMGKSCPLNNVLSQDTAFLIRIMQYSVIARHIFLPTDEKYNSIH
jgi:hypothetical protein